MGCLFSKPSPSSPPPPTRAVYQQHQSHEERNEPRKSLPLPDPPPGPDTTPSPVDPVQPDQQPISVLTPPPPDNTSQGPLPGSGGPNYTHVPRGVSRTTSRTTFDRPNPSLSPHHMSRSFSAGTPRNSERNDFQPLAVSPSSFKGSGYNDGSGNGTSHVSSRAGQKRATTSNTGSLLPTVHQMLPHGFRYALRPDISMNNHQMGCTIDSEALSWGR